MVLALRQHLLALERKLDRLLGTGAALVGLLKQLLPRGVVVGSFLDEFAHLTEGPVGSLIVTTSNAVVVLLIEALELVPEVRRVSLLKPLRDLVHAKVVEGDHGLKRHDRGVVARLVVRLPQPSERVLKKRLKLVASYHVRVVVSPVL